MKLTSANKAGLLMLTGGAQFVIAVMIGEALHPGYTIYGRHLSDLGAEPYSIVFNASVLIVGALFIAVSYYARQAFPRHPLFANLLLVAGIGPILVGVFSENLTFIARALGYNSLAIASWALHDIGAFIAYLFGGLAAILSKRITRAPFSYLLVVLGVITLFFLGLYVSGIHYGLGPGGSQRMVVYPELIWAIGLGGYLMAQEETRAGPSNT